MSIPFVREAGVRLVVRRRCIVAPIAAALLMHTRVVNTAIATKVYRIGVLDTANDPDSRTWKQFMAELARRGYIEGRNLVLERRLVDYRYPSLVNRSVNELVALKVDVLYATAGTEAVLAAKNATQTIPIVFYGSADPVGLGLVNNLSRPGGNVTGSSISAFDTDPKSLQFLVEAVGRSNSRIAYLVPTGLRSVSWFSKWVVSMNAAASQLGVTFTYADVGSIEEIELVLKRLAREGVEAVMVDSDPLTTPHMERIAALLIDQRLASIGDPETGFLLQYQADTLQLARKAAEYIDKILKGVRPSDLPVEQASTFKLIVNIKTAKAIGLKIPQSLLLRADEMIE
jgi:putative ABC transport system substrate-binding protein